MSKPSDLIHTSRLEVELLENHVKQSIRKHRHSKITETWKREKKLGAGGFGTVYLERCSQHEHKVRAVKQLAKSGGMDYNRELEAAALFSHQPYELYFVKSFGWYECPTFVYLTMEYLPLGDLRQYMGSAFPESEARLIIRQVLDGLYHMHERDFTHRDLKPANILVCEKGPRWWVKLTDFGISKRAVDGISGLHTQVYTPQFVAPELSLLSGEKSVFRTFPDLHEYWSSRTDLPVEKLVLRNISNKGQQFVASLLSSRPQDRPDVRACMDHTWLATDSSTLRSFRDLQMESDDNTDIATEFAPWTTIDHGLPAATDDTVTTELVAHEVDEISQTQIEASHRTSPSKFFESPQDSGIGESSVSISNAASVDILAADESDHPAASTPVLAHLEKRSGGTYAHVFSSSTSGAAEEYTTSGTREAFGPVVVEPTTLLWNKFKRLEGHKGGVLEIAFSPDGQRVVSGSEDGTIRLWDIATGVEVKHLEGHTNRVWTVAFSPDGRLIVSGSPDRTIRLWDVATGAEVKRLEGHTRTVWTVAFSADGQLVVSGSGDRTIRLWDAATGAEIKCLKGHSMRVYSVAFSPDRQLIGSGSDDKTIRLWDVATGVEVKRLEGHTRTVWTVAFSPDGQLIGSVSTDRTIRIWDVATGVEVKRLYSPSIVWAIAFSPDGRLVGSGSNDGSIRLLDVATGVEVKRLEGHDGAVWAIAFSPDGRLVGSAAKHDQAILWDMEASGDVIRPSGGRTYLKSLRSLLGKE